MVPIVPERGELNVSYSKHIPEPWRDETKRLVGECMHVLPYWLTRLNIEVGDCGGDIVAHIEPNFKYRHADLTLSNKFFTLDDQDKYHTMVHEFCHVLIAPLHQWGCDLLEEFKDNPEHNAWLQYMKSGLEGATEDYAQALLLTHMSAYRRGREEATTEYAAKEQPKAV